jgi:RNA polymerase sigma factor (TIGR02999 family)
MEIPQETEATRLIARMARGEKSAADALYPLVYGELRSQAERLIRGRSGGHTLQATALVHEAFLRLCPGSAGGAFEGRSHFVGVAAKAMRNVLVDHARRKKAEKRGGLVERVELEEAAHLLETADADLVEIHEALEGLAELDPDLARVVELRFFAGLSIEETAEALAVSVPTVVRDWRAARAWLLKELVEP